MTATITIEETKQPIIKQGVGAIARIEQLRRLIRERRFSTDAAVADNVHTDRQLYMETAVLLAKRAKYPERRVYRLGHEINKMFEVYFNPVMAHEIIEKAYLKDDSDTDIDAWMFDLDVTKEEYITMLGTEIE